jgi:cystathionine beta-lyase family protein involved in aluminum resistance
MTISTYELIKKSEEQSQNLFDRINTTAYENQKKVLEAFRKHQISPRHFAPTTGYGYDDAGRGTLNKLFAEIFHAERALVSPLIVNGTHALAVTLFGLLKTGDRILFATGEPYDTLQAVVRGVGNGSLADYGIRADVLNLKYGKVDEKRLKELVDGKKPDAVYFTRSRGYAWRDALSLEELKRASDIAKSANPSAIVIVDNCYGEFVDTREPTEAGADVVAGSLIKNPGGGLAPTGGYIAGKENCIARIAGRLTTPSLGDEVGSYNASYQPFYQGLFLAPSVVAAALKGSVLAGRVFRNLGYRVSPAPSKIPGDIIRSIRFRTAEELIAFCQSIQYSSPVDSHVTPYPWDMPGYQHKVIMAAGTFVQGASIELSADSPIKEPYIAYMQGGLTYEHCKIAIEEAVERIFANRKK